MTGDLEQRAATDLVDPETFLSPGTRDRIERSVPANTKAAYTRQAKVFLRWCAEHGRTPLPATPQTLADYVSHLADLGRAPATIEQAIAAIRTAHRQSGHRGHPDTEAALRVLRTHRRDWAEAGNRRKQSAPVTLDVIRAVVDITDPATLAGLRDRVLVVLGFSLMDRRSELANLRLGEVAVTPEGITAFIRFSKTDQDAAGATVHVPAGVHPDTDPVRVVQAWTGALAALGETDGPLLRQVNRWDQLQPGGMSGQAINARLKTLVTLAGVPSAAAITAHGLRAGGATEAAKAGHPVAFIAEHGRWSKNSPKVLDYIRSVDKWRDNPMRGIGL